MWIEKRTRTETQATPILRVEASSEWTPEEMLESVSNCGVSLTSLRRLDIAMESPMILFPLMKWGRGQVSRSAITFMALSLFPHLLNGDIKNPALPALQGNVRIPRDLPDDVTRSYKMLENN